PGRAERLGGAMRVGEDVRSCQQAITGSPAGEPREQAHLPFRMLGPELKEHTLLGQPEDGFARRDLLQPARSFPGDVWQDDAINRREGRLRQRRRPEKLQPGHRGAIRVALLTLNPSQLRPRRKNLVGEVKSFSERAQPRPWRG